MNKIKILVDGCGGDVAQGVIKALNKSKLNLEIYKICTYYNSSWLHVDDYSYISPLSVSDEYIPYLIRLLNTKNIDIFFPCVDFEIPKVALNKEKLESETPARVFVDEFDKVDICNDKYKTYNYFRNNNISSPYSVVPESLEKIKEIIDRVGFPLIIKKRIGQGAKDVKMINTYPEARDYIGKNQYILQEYIQLREGEYTTGIYIGDDKELKGICTLKRELKWGSTYRAERVINDKWEKYLIDIAKKIDMKYLNIQFRVQDDNIFPFELNGRFSGTTGIISRIFNAPEYFINERLLGKKIKYRKNNEIFYVMRYSEEIYSNQENVDNLLKRSHKI